MHQYKNVLVSFVQVENIQAKLKMWVVRGKDWPELRRAATALIWSVYEGDVVYLHGYSLSFAISNELILTLVYQLM